MQTFLVTFLFFAVIMLLMSLGVIFSGRMLKGSCGGKEEDCTCDETAKKRCSRERDESEAR